MCSTLRLFSMRVISAEHISNANWGIVYRCITFEKKDKSEMSIVYKLVL